MEYVHVIKLLLFSDDYANEIEDLSPQAGDISARIAPYFKQKDILLTEVEPKHIQNFYQNELTERKVSSNTVIHYHANIRKVLQYAMKMDLIPSNPADKVERP